MHKFYLILAALFQASTMSGLTQLNAASPIPLQAKDITFMVYAIPTLNNEIFKFNIEEMSKTGTTDNLNLVIESANEDGSSSRMLLQKSPKSPLILSKEKEVDSGDYHRLADFISWTKLNFPARHYVLVLLGHGSAWLDPNYNTNKDFQSKGILLDPLTLNYIHTNELAKIFKMAGKVDVLAMNSCQMQSAEIIYELKDSAKVIIGAEESMPGRGFIYTDVISYLNKNPTLLPREIGKVFIKTYHAYYSRNVQWSSPTIATLSEIDTSMIPLLPNYLKQWSKAVMAETSPSEIIPAIKSVLRFDSILKKEKGYSPLADLKHFVKLVSSSTNNALIKQNGDELIRFLTESLIVDNVSIVAGNNGSAIYNNSDYNNAGGVSIALPPITKNAGFAKLMETYKNLSLSKDSEWNEFIDWLNIAY